MSDKAELAKRVLQALKQGHAVSTNDALQLRNWAVTSEDSVLSLEAIAHRILAQANDPKPTAGGKTQQVRKTTISGA